MRLLDLVAQSRNPSVIRSGVGRCYPVYGAAELAQPLRQCATRYVLTDELTRLCAELAYSTKDELTKCLDLVRLPAESVWIEWNEAAEIAGCRDFFHPTPLEETEPSSRAGIHIVASATGRQAALRFIWSEGSQPVVSPFTALIDFEEGPSRRCPLGDLSNGGWMAVTDPSRAVAELLSVARFCLEPGWARYYRAAAHIAAEQSAVRESLGGPARTIPFLIAFLLLLSSREGVAVRPVSWEVLNRKRAKSGKGPLLSHVEAALALAVPSAARNADLSAGSQRVTPRRHLVRGHLVRRFNRVFWRRPHVRGSILRGEVKSRTVTLSFEASRGSPAQPAARANVVQLIEC